MEKFCFIDVETTGLNPVKNGIHQISGIIDINRTAKHAFDFRIAPFESDIIIQEALDMSGATVDQIQKYPDPEITFEKLIGILDKFINKYDKKDKFIFIGFNSNFDDGFLRALFDKNNHDYYGSYFRWPDFCVARMYMERCLTLNQYPTSWKLKNLAADFKLAKSDDERWHDAMFDIRMTRAFFYILKDWVPGNPKNWGIFTETNIEEEFLPIKTRT